MVKMFCAAMFITTSGSCSLPRLISHVIPCWINCPWHQGRNHISCFPKACKPSPGHRIWCNLISRARPVRRGVDRRSKCYYTYVCMSELVELETEEKPMQSLPPRQQDVLNPIVELTDGHGYPPTLQELATALGLKNRMTVHQHVVALKKKGLVIWEPKLNRSLRVAQEGLSYVTVDRNKHPVDHDLGAIHEDEEEHQPSGVPLAGRIAAGRPIDAFETPEYLRID